MCMKKILFILLLSPLAFAEKNEMIPLGDYIDGIEGDLEASEFLYVSYRCAGLYGMMYALMESAPQEGASDAAKRLSEAQTASVAIAELLYNELTPEDERDFTDNLTRSVLPIADNYQREANTSWTNSGSYFNDYIQNDANLCRVMVENLNK
jgi:hypothetical protein